MTPYQEYSLPQYMTKPQTPPALNIPSSSATVSVKLIDSTCVIHARVPKLFGPHIPGHDDLGCPAYCFLVEHASGRKVLFDLGTRKDWENLSPQISKLIRQPGWELEVEKNVSEILQEGGVSLDSIEAVVWSHWHYDHTGDMTTFPSSTKLIVGPGFKKAFVPAYPTVPDSPLLDTDWQGRDLVELNFDQSVQVGRFRAMDYFGDGSFYLVDVPGHAIGHLCGLARVCQGDTFVFMGADACHHGGEFRPTPYCPLPTRVQPSPMRSRSVCPGSLFTDVFHHHQPDQVPYRLTQNFSFNTDQANDSIDGVKEFDAHDNVFVIIAHDKALLEQESNVQFFPRGNLNNWRRDDSDGICRWLFLRDFEHAVENGIRQGTELEEGQVIK